MAIVIGFFLLAFIPLFSVKIEEMGTGQFYIFQVTPIEYWVGISAITAIIFGMIARFKDERFRFIFILASILLMVSCRMVFPTTFTSVPAYEPDASDYMRITSSWVTLGVNFGVEGNYQHNFPLSFLVAFIFGKLGVSLDNFYRIAPFVIYAVNMIFLYLLIKEVMPQDKKLSVIPLLSVFLFSFSSLGYWVTVHYCPDLFGSLMYFICLYLAVRFAKGGEWTLKSVLPVFACLFLLILSHHLSTLYLIVTLFGLALSVWFFKAQDFKRGALAFFILGIFTYTVWFAYGTLVYPSFFDVYVYFSGFTGVVQQAVQADLFTNLTFVVYPAFVMLLFFIEFVRVLKIGNPLGFVKNIRGRMREIRERESGNPVLVFTFGFIIVFFLFAVGIGVPVLFGARILEVLCIGLFPLASQTLLTFAGENSSRKKRGLIFVIVLLVVLISVYRYDSQIQRRVNLV